MRWIGCGALIACAACGNAAAGGGTASTRDSSGVSIIENTGPSWPAGQGWKVVDSPLVDIGDVDRAFGPVRLKDGRLAIANAGTSEVRLYDAKGAHLKTAGRAGAGPGEYQNLGGIWLGPGDSVMVSDILVRRLSVLDDTTGYARSLSLGGAAGAMVPTDGKIDFATPIGWFGDGTIVGQAQTFSIGQARVGIHRDTVTVIRYGPDGSGRDTVGRFPGMEMDQMTMTFGGRTMGVPSPVPLGRQTVTLARGDRFFASTNDAWEIQVRSLDGSLKQLVRTAVKAAPITSADIAQNKKDQLAQFDALPQMRSVPAELKKQLTDRVEQAKYPATFPFFAGFLLDEAGNLWAEEVTAPSQKTQRFAVVDSSGRFLGRVMMPRGFKASHIGSEAVYGVWKDADDVEHIRSYPLKKAAGPSR